MNRKWWKLIYLLPICLCTLYAGGYVAQFIYNYQIWSATGNFAGNGTYPQAASLTPNACLMALTRFPYNLYGIFLCLLAFGLLTFLVMRMGYDRNGEIFDKERNLNYSTKGTYGTSGFMTPDEMHKVLELTDHVKKNKGTILGKLNGKAVCLPYETRMNRNVAVYGASGSMKSRAYARNMIFQCVSRGESLIITDPKSELYESMAGYLENEGYTVRCLSGSQKSEKQWGLHGSTGADETRVQVLKEEERRAQTQSFMWLFRSGEDGLPAIILYGYSPTRSGSHAKEFLEGYHGYLETDGYQGYNSLPDIKRCSCWAHIRRYFIDAVPKGKQYDYSQPAVQGVQYCNRLFAIEDSINKKYPGDYEKRKQLRLEKEKPVLEAFWLWLEHQKPVR